MNFVNGERSIEGVEPMSILHPFPISPIIMKVPHHRSGLRRTFPSKGIRVSFIHLIGVVPGKQVVFIGLSVWNPRDKSLPYPWTILSDFQGMGFIVPLIKVSLYGDFLRIWSPQSKVCALGAIKRENMWTKLIIEIEVVSFLKEIDIMVC
jgi:hypothetical protein